MTDFQPALPAPAKWSVGDNNFDTTGKNPRSMSLFIPLESVDAFCDYLKAIALDQSKHKTGKVWDYSSSTERTVEGIYINGKGRDGRTAGSSFGTINPAMAIAPAEENPF